MIKINTLRALKECGVVAVVRGNSKEVGVEISKACVKGGVKALEVAYTNKFANDIIKELCEIYEGQDDVVIGAGTVLDAETARAAMLAGAKYIVSPAFDLETAKICNRYKVPYLPGIMTINEIITAHEAGVDFVKLFPGSSFGQGYVKAIKGPLPYANIMVTGGVNIDNIDSWIKAGVDAVGCGVVCNGFVTQLLDLGPGGLRLQQGMIDMGQDLFAVHVRSSVVLLAGTAHLCHAHSAECDRSHRCRCTNDAQHQTGNQECEPFQTTFHNTVPPENYCFFLKIMSLLNT